MSRGRAELRSQTCSQNSRHQTQDPEEADRRDDLHRERSLADGRGTVSVYVNTAPVQHHNLLTAAAIQQTPGRLTLATTAIKYKLKGFQWTTGR